MHVQAFKDLPDVGTHRVKAAAAGPSVARELGVGNVGGWNPHARRQAQERMDAAESRRTAHDSLH
jgi:hypothetical protein